MKQIRQAAMRAMAAHLNNLITWEENDLYSACYFAWLARISADMQKGRVSAR